MDIVSNPLKTWLSEGLWQVQILRLMWTFLVRMTNSRKILGRVFLVECDDCFCRLHGPQHDKLKRKQKHLQYNIFTLWWLWTDLLLSAYVQIQNSWGLAIQDTTKIGTNISWNSFDQILLTQTTFSIRLGCRPEKKRIRERNEGKNQKRSRVVIDLKSVKCGSIRWNRSC